MNPRTLPAAPASGRADPPPGPPHRWFGLPLMGAMRRNYLGFVQGLKDAHGDISHFRILNERAYDLFTPDLVREALVDHAPQLIRWERGPEVFAQLMGQSVLVTEGDTWQRQRRMLAPAFTPRRVAGYATLMTDAAAAALDAALPAGQAAGRADMDALFTRVTMDVILRTLFSSGAEVDSPGAAAAVQTLSATAMREMFWPVTLPDWLPLPGKAAKRRAHRVMQQLVGGHIQARRDALRDGRAAPADDLLAMLLALRDQEGGGESAGPGGSVGGAALSEAEVYDQCMVSFQAGHETSATALLWWSRLMAEHPAAAQQAADEVDAVLAGRTPVADDLAALPFVTATLKEAMRLYPPVSALMTRRTTAPITLGGWAIPRGALLRLTPFVLHRDARWFDQPDSFRPQRFLPDAPPLPKGAWMPFGTGPRVCIGQHFAMLEMVLVAAMLLQRWRLALPADARPARPVMNVTLRPKGGVVLDLQRRDRGHRSEPPGVGLQPPAAGKP